MVEVPMSPGEALDRLSILSIKAARLQGTPKGTMAMEQLVDLRQRCDFLPSLISSQDRPDRPIDAAARHAVGALMEVNERLWDVEDEVRALLRGLPGLTGGDAEKVGANISGVLEFALCAARVPILNDERAKIKRDFDILSNSSAVEVKSYV
jgi:hypothetical protein